MNQFYNSLGGFACCFLVVLAGCGGEQKVDVSGEILLGNKLAPAGRIRLVSNAGLPARSMLFVDGKFGFLGDQGILPGTYTIEVTAQEPTGQMVRVSDQPDHPVAEMREYKYQQELIVTDEPINNLKFTVSNQPKLPRRSFR